MKSPARITARDFFEKTWKKVLTNGGRFGILPKLSAPLRARRKKVLKNWKKVLDKRDRVWYSIKAVHAAEACGGKSLKKLEKSS